MSETARVVVVGGGIWGCSIAYHLARVGVSDVLVLERRELASGNTSQAAGLVGQLRASELMARSIMAVVERLARWQAEHGEDSGFRQVGSLKLALTDARVRELEAQVTQARRWGLAVELIAPRDAQARVPLLETSVYLRPEVGGVLVGGFESAPKRFAMADLPATFMIEETERDQRVLEELGAGLTRAFPALQAAPIIRGCAGLPTFTPDGNFLVGQVPSIHGLYAATGCNALGIAGSLLIGQWMSELIVDGKTSVDLSTQALTRFGSRYGSRGRLQGDCESIYANFYALDKGAF